MKKMLMTGSITAGLLALAPMIPALGFQEIQTFKQASVVVPHGGTMATAAMEFCTIRGFSSASAFDPKTFVEPTEATAGMAVFKSVSCKTYTPTMSNG